MTDQGMTFRRHVRVAAVLCLAGIVLSACAHRAPRVEIEAAAGGRSAPQGGSAAGVLGEASDGVGELDLDGVPIDDPEGGAAVPEAGGELPGADGPSSGPTAGGGEAASGGAASGGSSGGGGNGGSGGNGSGGSRQADRSPVVIGHIGTYSGIIGAIFSGGQQMAQAWAQDVNSRGGLDGHPVEIVTADDGGDPSRAQALVRDMVENRGALAFVGNLTILTTQAYQDYVQSNGIPVVGGDLYQVGWWEVPMLFPNGTYIDSTIVGLADQAVRRGGPAVGVVRCVETFACRRTGAVLGGGAADSVGARIVYDTEVSLAQPNFTRECLSAQNSGAEALIVATDVNAISRLARDCRSQGYEPLLVATSLSATDAAAADPNLDGMVVVSAVFPWTATDTPGAAAHAEVLERYAPNVRPSGSTSQVWAAAKLLEAAASDLPDDPGSEDIVEGLYALGDDVTVGGLTPPLNFNRDRPADRSPCYSVILLRGGSFTAPNGSKFTCL